MAVIVTFAYMSEEDPTAHNRTLPDLKGLNAQQQLN